MSTLQVANVHLESTANNRIQYFGSNLVSIVAGGSNTFVANSTDISLVTGGAERMRIDSSGNVGIGTSSPSTKLDVNGDGRFGSRIQQQNSGGSDFEIGPGAGTGNTQIWGFYAPASRIISFSTNANERVRIDGSGNLQFNSGYGSVATAYGCRAWVSFDGDPVTIRADGGVSSITDVNIGTYTINFDFTMPDANYAVIGSVGSGSRVAQGIQQGPGSSPSTGSCQVMTGATSAAAFTAADYDYNFVAFFR